MCRPTRARSHRSDRNADFRSRSGSVASVPSHASGPSEADDPARTDRGALDAAVARYRRAERAVGWTLGLLVAVVFLGVGAAPSFWAGIAVGLALVAALRVPAYRRRGFTRLRTGAPPEAVVREFASARPPVLAFQWGVDEIRVSGDGAADSGVEPRESPPSLRRRTRSRISSGSELPRSTPRSRFGTRDRVSVSAPRATAPGPTVSPARRSRSRGPPTAGCGGRTRPRSAKRPAAGASSGSNCGRRVGSDSADSRGDGSRVGATTPRSRRRATRSPTGRCRRRADSLRRPTLPARSRGGARGLRAEPSAAVSRLSRPRVRVTGSFCPSRDEAQT